jgi:transposase-like protein
VTHDTPASFALQGFGTPAQHELLGDKESYIRAISLQITTQMLQKSVEAEVSAELGLPYEERGDGLSTWQCRRCGTHNRREFRRNGHYRRALTVREGTVALRMPLVRCRCRGYVKIPWQTVNSRARYWLDVELDGIRRYMAGMSYRLVGDAASTEAQTNISHVQSWRTMQEAGQATGDVPVSLTPCPRSVIVDEAYVSVEGTKKVFLVAVADDGRVLAVWGPTERTLDAWQGLLEWLTEHGISPLQGLVGVTYDGDSAIRGAVQLVWPRVVLQQCVWHILERVADNVSAVHGPHAPEVESIVDQAARILLRDPERPDALERARLRLAQFLVEHGEATWAQTVARAFDEGTEYLRTPGLHRTNGLAERTIKELRRRTKTMDGFKSDDGSVHFMVIWRVWKNMRSQMNKERARLVRHGRRNLKIRHAHPKSA